MGTTFAYRALRRKYGGLKGQIKNFHAPLSDGNHEARSQGSATKSQ
jgi:hypothetical protein